MLVLLKNQTKGGLMPKKTARCPYCKKWISYDPKQPIGARNGSIGYQCPKCEETFWHRPDSQKEYLCLAGLIPKD